MKYIIMCGGEYDIWKTPKQLINIKGERLVDRTIRLLKENGIEDIAISSNNPLFDSCGVPRLEHENSFKIVDGKDSGYWLDAYYPVTEPVCYLYGDVYYTPEAIKTIVECDRSGNILFGSGIAKNELHKNWGEPFAYKVEEPDIFFKGIEAVKKMQDLGVTKRMPITWELYRYLNNLNVNIQQVKDETYICIDDGTDDIDDPEEIERYNGE